ncbi:hypothetical protein [Croceicoccus gelatinilyticus]|uniref:hypothetical protein n=1 Tax=Croceicoccus gelatinilyticus TaxID=2835536 RepID=UPI001BCE5E6B|nr:hypothetical protein [Croceicoccus gelatinilyticus]MBS7670977.1 hypothetical protein [Croceicoccus gelatinilyticus]
MAESKRDPSIGKEWLAWYALNGDEPLEFVGEYLMDALPILGGYIAKSRQNMSQEDEAFLSGLHLVLIGLAGAVNGDGSVPYKLTRAKRGKPINKHDRALNGHRAAAIVESLVALNIKQEAAVAQATEETGMSRAEIFTWLKHRRDWSDPEWRANFVQTLLEKHRAKDI